MKIIPMQRYRPIEAPKVCDQCGNAPCQTRGLCHQFRLMERKLKQHPPEQNGRPPANWDAMSLGALWELLNKKSAS